MGRFLHLGDTPIIAVSALQLLEEAKSTHSLKTIATRRTTQAIVDSGCSAIIYLAGLSRPSDCEENPKLSEHLNILLPSWLASLACDSGVNFVYASSEYVYDNCAGKRPFDEDASLMPRSLYGQHKLDGERGVLMRGGGNVYILRLGKGIDVSLQTDGIFTDALQTAFCNRPVLAASDQYFNPFDVTALGSIMQGLMLNDLPGIYNVGSREVVSRFEFLELFRKESRIDWFKLSECSLGDILGNQQTSNAYLGMNTTKLLRLMPAEIATAELIAAASAANSKEWLSKYKSDRS